MNTKKISALALAFVLSAGISVKAATSLPTTEKNDKEGRKIEFNKDMHKRKHRSGVYRTAKDMGLTKKELNEAREKGLNFFELAKKKGYTEQQVKDKMIKNKSEGIDKAVENGKITAEKASELKVKMKQRISEWDGTLRSKKDLEQKGSKQ
jgi:hypothetical protein